MKDVRFETFGLNAKLLQPPKPMDRVHHHQEVELNYVFRGEVTYLHGAAVQRFQPRELAVFWGSTPHTIIAVEPNSEMAWFTVPLAWVWSWNLPEAFTRNLMEGKCWIVPQQTEEDRFPMRAWVREFGTAGQSRRRALLLELQACFMWLSEHASAPVKPEVMPVPPESGGLKHVEAMARCMAERFRDDIDIADVARAAGLHPNYAMPLFRRHSGVTIRYYLLQHRVNHAQRLLFMTDQKIVDIALASGFVSLSAFYEAFNRMVKTTPQAYRKRIRQS